jgi:hypothetical protein
MPLLAGGAYYYQTHLNTIWTTAKGRLPLDAPDATEPTTLRRPDDTPPG